MRGEGLALSTGSWALACCLASCGGLALGAERGPEARAWRYELRIDDALSRLEVDVCFEGPAPPVLAPIDRRGRRFLRSADGPLGPDAAPLPRDADVVFTAHLPPDACVRYVVDLDAAARQRGGITGAYRVGDDLIASTTVWLWAPRPRAPDARASARFTLPEGVVVSPLWPRDAERWYLDARAFELEAFAAFGRFEVRHVGVPGACLHVSLLGRRVAMGHDALSASLARSAGAAALLFGRFPVSEASILAVPTPLSTTSPFGVVGRGTLPTVAILVGEQAAPERLERAWVPVHEFSHLAVPLIERDDAWLSEGLATYYQEILRARAGLIAPEEAWRNLDDGFARGRAGGTGRSLADESRDMRRTAAYRRVYWAGAAIALAADVGLRARGARSLDDALAELHACCHGGARPMPGRDAIERLDAASDGVFGRVARAALGSSELLPLERTYRRLGLSHRADGSLAFDDAPDARALRDAITSPPAALDDVPPCGPWYARP